MSSIHAPRFICSSSGWRRSQHLTTRLTSTSSSDRKIMPMREMVAGDAKRRSCVSKRKLTLAPKLMRSPLGIVSRWLSSSTELSDSIHSGSTSPSHTIQLRTSSGSRTTCRAAAVRTPSVHSRVSGSISPSSRCRGMDLGFITYVLTTWPILSSAACSTRHSVDLPQPEGPTMTQPMRWSSDSFSCSILRTWPSSNSRLKGLLVMTSLIASSSSAYRMSSDDTPGKTSATSARKRCASSKVSLDSVFTRTALIRISASSDGVSSMPSRFECWMRLPPVLRHVFMARRPQS
mmetsp:Transcript_24478/g.85111  ORF Transcript_24478/g.85111 Transcript_24478/m.85111 type:complete len:290 (-) Transcript_24478:553-1422(-)